MDESGVLPLPALPVGWGDPGRSYWVFGWALSPEEYKVVLEKRWGYKEPAPSNTVLWNLELETRYRHIFATYGKPDEQARADGLVLTDLPDECVHVMAITSTASPKRYLRRPKQKQYDLMRDVLGKEPRWFECAASKEEYKDNMELFS